jgi:hypothetical protein
MRSASGACCPLTFLVRVRLEVFEWDDVVVFFAPEAAPVEFVERDDAVLFFAAELLVECVVLLAAFFCVDAVESFCDRRVTATAGDIQTPAASAARISPRRLLLQKK